VEHICDTLGQQLNERQPLGNLQHVEEILLEEWEEVTPQVIQNLIESMPRRSAEVLGVRRAHTYY
jgi:hypothetical protein